MRKSRRLTAVLVLALALAAPLASTAPVTALGETLADLSTGLLTKAESKFGPPHRYASRRLAAGASGTDVAVLQRFLTEVGLKTAVTGYYGPESRANVRRWEARGAGRADGSLSRDEARRLRGGARRHASADRGRVRLAPPQAR